MSQSISVSVTMDPQGFRDFAMFDTFRHRKAWLRPAVFAAIMLVFSAICLSQLGKRQGAGLLAAVLAIVGIGLPASYFGSFFRSLSKQIRQMHLPRAFYRVELSDAGIAVWMYGKQDKPEPTNRHPWESFYCAYRTQGAVYLYVEKEKAYLLNDRQDTVWKFLSTALPAEKLHDCRK